MKQILALGYARKPYDGKVVLSDVTLAFLPGPHRVTYGKLTR